MHQSAHAEHVAVVRPVQNAVHAIELHANPRTGDGLDDSTHVPEQRFDVAPVNIAAGRIMEDRANQIGVAVTHAQSNLNGVRPSTALPTPPTAPAGRAAPPPR